MELIIWTSGQPRAINHDGTLEYTDDITHHAQFKIPSRIAMDGEIKAFLEESTEEYKKEFPNGMWSIIADKDSYRYTIHVDNDKAKFDNDVLEKTKMFLKLFD